LDSQERSRQGPDPIDLFANLIPAMHQLLSRGSSRPHEPDRISQYPPRERSAIYRLVGRMGRMKNGRTVLECTGSRETDAAEFPVGTWIRLKIDETTAVAYVQRSRLPSEGP
jgi:hypothetical protein